MQKKNVYICEHCIKNNACSYKRNFYFYVALTDVNVFIMLTELS